MVRVADRTYDRDAVKYLNAAQSAFHCVAEVKRRLEEAGFVELDERVSWKGLIKPKGKYFFTRNGSTLLAFGVGGKFDEKTSGCIVVGAHTDSPCPKLKPISKLEKAGSKMMGVVGYGGGKWGTWFDRDLTLVGRALVKGRDGRSVRHALVNLGRPILRIPTLAIHLSINDERTTFKPNLQSHLPPMLATGIRDALASGAGDAPGGETGDSREGILGRHDAVVVGLVAEHLGCAPSDLLELELQLADTQPAALIGAHEEFVSSGRLDNQGSCYCGTVALCESVESLDDDASVRMLTMFDHEEVGSLSAQGAQSPAFLDCMDRLYAALGGSDFFAFKARSFQISSDMAHGLHPNYAERHDPKHGVKLQGGLVIKHNANQRYATNAVGAAYVREFAKIADVPIQDFAVKADSACGTTIGPITAAGTGVRTVDVGPPQLSMHSVREMMGTDDLYYSIKTFKAAFEHYHAASKHVDVDGPDTFWADPGQGWATATA